MTVTKDWAPKQERDLTLTMVSIRKCGYRYKFDSGIAIDSAAA
jgi:hypothetical protein